MSDPVSNAEIEDVLSSIRRLVSDDHRDGSAQAPSAAEGGEPQSDRLVLTPALRVAKHEPAQDDVAGTDDGGQPAADEEPDLSPLRLEPEDLSEPRASEDHPDDHAQIADPEHVDVGLDVVTADGFMFDDTVGEAGEAQPPWRDPETTLYEAAEQVADTDTEDGAKGDADQPSADEGDATAALEDVSENPDRDGEESDGLQVAEPGDPGPVFFRSMRDEEYEEDQAPVEWQAPPFEMAESPESGSESEAADPVTLSAKIEALEAAIARRKEEWEPDGDSTDDYAAAPMETLEWEDHEDEADQDTTAPPEPAMHEAAQETDLPDHDLGGDPDTAVPEEPIDVLSAEETVLDEDSLRELVADIVREELQGALGERITRNVRKLVRREIHRALTAQELD